MRQLRPMIVVAAAGCLAVVTLLPALPSVALQETVTMRDGLALVVRNRALVVSKKAIVGEIIEFEVVRDLVVDGAVVVEAGTTALGHIIEARGEGALGKAGEVIIGIDTTTSVDGQTIVLRGTAGREGDSKAVASIALGAVLCPLFLLKKGGKGDIPTGSEFKVYTENSYEIDVTSEAFLFP